MQHSRFAWWGQDRNPRDYAPPGSFPRFQKGESKYLGRESKMHSMKTTLFLGILLICIATPVYPDDDPVSKSRELYQEAVTAYQEGDYPGMLRSLDAAVELRPHHPTLVYSLAAAQALSGETGKSIETLNRLAEMGVIVDPAGDEDFQALNSVFILNSCP